MSSTEFTITEQHLKLSRRVYMSWWEMEFGAPCVDPKRPYGNSHVIGDIIDILKLDIKFDDEKYEYPEGTEEQLYSLHREMQTVIQIFLCTGEIRTGTYVRKSEYDDLSWHLVS